jgi:ABC-type uncharacterized transport system permease subunit
MDKISFYWNWLSGKKTAIGATLLTLAFVLAQFESEILVKIWEVAAPAWIDKAVLTLQYVGSAFSGVGLIHRRLK